MSEHRPRRHHQRHERLTDCIVITTDGMTYTGPVLLAEVVDGQLIVMLGAPAYASLRLGPGDAFAIDGKETVYIST